jgi:hypothetical protein
MRNLTSCAHGVQTKIVKTNKKSFDDVYYVSILAKKSIKRLAKKKRLKRKTKKKNRINQQKGNVIYFI